MTTHDLVTYLVQVILGSGTIGGGYKLLTWRQQRQNMAAGVRKIDSETQVDEANAAALLSGPYERAAARAELSAERAERARQIAENENEDLRERISKSERRADNAERRLAQIEQYIEGPMRAWQVEAIGVIHDAHLTIRPAPAMASWRGSDT